MGKLLLLESYKDVKTVAVVDVVVKAQLLML
jgi:hypothetical protein